MSWSFKILFLYLGFVALILTLVFTCFGHRTELEYKDYYARELTFQNQMVAQENANRLSQPIEHSVHNGVIELHFPAELLPGVTGTIELLRPSDASKDLKFDIAPDAGGRQTLNGLHKGVYKMRLTASKNNTDYFKEAVITIR